MHSHLFAAEATSRQTHTAAIAVSVDGIVCINHHGEILEFNPAAEKMFGYRREDVIGKCMADFIIPSRYRSAHSDGMSRFMSTGVSRVLDSRVQITACRADGSEFPVELTISSLELDHHCIFTAFIRDRTNDVAEELKAREKWKHERLASDLTQVATLGLDFREYQHYLLKKLGEFFDVSRAYIFMHRPEEGVTDNTAEWVAPGVTPEIGNLQGVPDSAVLWWIEKLRSGEVIEYSDIEYIDHIYTRNMLLEQGIRSILVYPLFIGSRYYGFIGVDECRYHRDWTSLEKQSLQDATRILMGVWADVDIQRSEKKISHLLDHANNIAVIGYNQKGLITYWNKASEYLYGYSRQEALGQSVMDLIHPSDKYESASRSVSRHYDSAFELQRKRRDGTEFMVLSTKVATQGPAAQVEFYSFDIDLRPLKKVEQERLDLQSRLAQSQKMETVGLLSSGISHDFNNLLTIITGFAELTQLILDPSSPAFDYLNQIMQAAKRGAAITKQLSIFNRKQNIMIRPIDINKAILQFQQMVRRVLKSNITLETILPNIDEHTLVDPDQLSQIIMNLVVNASDAMPEGGNITIETASCHLDEETARRHAVQPGRYTILTVRDNGTGMDEQTRTRVFEPFFSTKPVGQGTGLGLSIVFGIVKHSGGFIEVESVIARGTTMKIYLPQVKGIPETDVIEFKKLDENKGSENILVVDDEISLADAIASALERCGYNVIKAANGIEAIRLAKMHSEKIDMLISDLVMPELGGLQLASALTAIWPHIKLIIISGNIDKAGDIDAVVPVGAVFLAKPFTLKTLAETVRRTLDTPR